MTAVLHDHRSTDFDAGVAAGRPVAVLLHGYGSNELDLAGLAPALGLALPWASLRAPVSLGGTGAAWFAIGRPGDPDAAPVEKATEAVWRWTDAVAGESAQVVPIGFSQGGLMVSQLLRTRPERVIAPVVLGGFVLGAPQPADERLREARPALFWGRGGDDQVITPQAVARTAGYLQQHTALDERVYPGLAHGISAAEIADVRAFIAARAGAEAVRQPWTT